MRGFESGYIGWSIMRYGSLVIMRSIVYIFSKWFPREIENLARSCICAMSSSNSKILCSSLRRRSVGSFLSLKLSALLLVLLLSTILPLSV